MADAKSLHLDAMMARQLRADLSHLEGEVWKIRRLLSTDQSCEEVIAAFLRLKADVNRIAHEMLRGHLESCVFRRPSLESDEEGLRSLRFLLDSALA
ncbi:MAG: metal-sensing transcriptional repressor [Gemmatimonadetes bacterium]|nr:metal-sensing transcriptional repressor [Gemmatimonadota bacterium]